MDEWVAFLNARLDEREKWAGEFARLLNEVHMQNADTPEHRRAVTAFVFGQEHTDPGHLLREVAAMRKILDRHAPAPFYGNNPPRLPCRTLENVVAWYCEYCKCPDGIIEDIYPCDDVHDLAAVYSDHLDYPGAH